MEIHLARIGESEAHKTERIYTTSRVLISPDSLLLFILVVCDNVLITRRPVIPLALLF